MLCCGGIRGSVWLLEMTTITLPYVDKPLKNIDLGSGEDVKNHRFYSPPSICVPKTQVNCGTNAKDTYVMPHILHFFIRIRLVKIIETQLPENKESLQNNAWTRNCLAVSILPFRVMIRAIWRFSLLVLVLLKINRFCGFCRFLIFHTSIH